MSDEAAGQETARPRKRLSAKTVIQHPATKVKATIHLSPDADKRLSVHATMMEMDRSELVEKLINDHLRRYVIQDRARPEGATSGDAVA